VEGGEEVTDEIEKFPTKAGGVFGLLRRAAGAVVVATVVVAIV